MEVAVINVGDSQWGTEGRHKPSLCFKGDGLTAEQQQKPEYILHKWAHVFAKHEEDYGYTCVVKHKIPTGEVEPDKER